MNVPMAIDLLDDERLRELYDPGSLQRGRAYAGEGRAQLLGTGGDSIKAVCRGSGQATYIVDIRWTGRGEGVVLDDTCTCPIGGGCKHCVAAILTARREAQRNRAGPGHRRGTGDGDGDGDGGAPVEAWRQLLSDLVPGSGGSGNGQHGHEAVPLGLQFVVDRPRPAQWTASAEPRVLVRPVRRGKGGGWVKAGASWRDLTSSQAPALDEADPAHVSALRTLVTSGRIGHYDTNAQGVPLARFGADVWLHLARAVDAGVALVGERAGLSVSLSSVPARASVDLVADPGGAVTVTTGFVLDDGGGGSHAREGTASALGADDGHDGTLDGEKPRDDLRDGDGGAHAPERLDVPGEHGGLLGEPAHGLWVAEGKRLRLIPLAAPLHPTVARLVAVGPMAVPAGDVDELLDVYQPALARHAAVGSADGSVAITTTRFDRLALRIERTALDTARLRWLARYRRGERTVDHPLHQRPGPSRDPEAEAVAEREVDLPTHLLPILVGPAGGTNGGTGGRGGPQDVTVSGSAVVTLLTEVVPWLEAKADVDVEVVGDQPDLREGDPLISLEVTDGGERRAGPGGDDRHDWFDLDVEVTVDGQAVDFARLFYALDRGDEALILPSGTWLRLDRPELVRLRELIDEARGLADPTSDGVARLNPFQVSWWDELCGLGVVAHQSRRWADSVARMGALTAPEPVPVPAGLDATLRHYQQDGLDWLAFLYRNGLGGILADDMGLGKTVQALALVLHVLEQRPDGRALVVAPTSVVENWARETARFAPGLAFRTIRESEARRGTPLDQAIEGAGLVITSYALFRIEHEAYARHEWDVLLLDEAQFVKNHQGKTYQCARRVDARTKVAMTGTPLENTLMDLWALLSITAPGLYPDPKRFGETYRRPIERGDAPELLATLRRRIAPLVRRRTKAEVLTELPPKTEQVVEVELSPRHDRIYATRLQQERRKVLGLVDNVQKNRFEILRSLTVLRQLALDPALIDDEHEGVGSAKLDRLLDDLGQVVAEGHRALVFSQFTRFLARVRARLDDAGIDHAYLDGRTRHRDEAISRFKDGDAPVFVISLKAGGFGLNLTEADYCFVLDPWWNPATETQAVDRAHRMGQQNPVMVYRYVSAGTIEEKVMALKERKAALFTSVVDAEGALSGALSEADIRGLFDAG